MTWTLRVALIADDGRAGSSREKGSGRGIFRLLVQSERVLEVNDLTVITSDVVETARSTRVIGDT